MDVFRDPSEVVWQWCAETSVWMTHRTAAEKKHDKNPELNSSEHSMFTCPWTELQHGHRSSSHSGWEREPHTPVLLLSNLQKRESALLHFWPFPANQDQARDQTRTSLVPVRFYRERFSYSIWACSSTVWSLLDHQNKIMGEREIWSRSQLHFNAACNI